MQFLSKIRWLAITAIILGVTAVALAQRFPPGVRPGGMPAPRMPGMPGQQFLPPPNPVQVRVEMQNLLATQPHEVFTRLNSDRGQALTAAERLDLARQAITRLAARVQVSNNRWVTLTEVRSARSATQNATAFDPAIRESLNVLVRLAENRALADAVFEVHHLADRAAWSEVVRRGQEWEKRLRGLDPWGVNKSTVQTRREVHAALAGLVRCGREREALDALQEGLQTDHLDSVTAANLPPRLHDGVQGLRGLKKVRELAGESRLRPAEITVLKQNLDAFTKSLRLLPDADAALSAKILQDLAIRHFLEGHPAEYRALMPVDGPADHAARLLRDIKALTLGKGEVVTAPARQALAGKANDIPAGIRSLLSEEACKKWRAPRRGDATVEQTPLAKAAQVGETLRLQIETNLKTERITQEERTKGASQKIESAQRRLQEQEEADGKRLAEMVAAPKKQAAQKSDKTPRK
ncbi:MAG TPA: hypothetical protein VN688_11420 [Gemmataceae bacterium]|nr:hypothetical protein [Gemmataceae bacterium]